MCAAACWGSQPARARYALEWRQVTGSAWESSALGLAPFAQQGKLPSGAPVVGTPEGAWCLQGKWPLYCSLLYLSLTLVACLARVCCPTDKFGPAGPWRGGGAWHAGACVLRRGLQCSVRDLGVGDLRGGSGALQVRPSNCRSPGRPFLSGPWATSWLLPQGRAVSCPASGDLETGNSCGGCTCAPSVKHLCVDDFRASPESWQGVLRAHEAWVESVRMALRFLPQ